MNRTFALTLLVTALAAGLALALPNTRASLLGVAIASGTALASLGAHRLLGGSGGKPVQRALAVFAVMFLARIVLVALGVVLVHRMHESAVAFVTAFFVPYFAFTAIEGGYLHALGRQQGKPA